MTTKHATVIRSTLLVCSVRKKKYIGDLVNITYWNELLSTYFAKVFFATVVI